MTASSISDTLPEQLTTSSAEAEELHLIAQAKKGCADSFRQLVERHQQPIYRFCLHYLHDSDDALEASQDTFVRAHRALGRFHPRTRLSSWLFRIALNLCRDRLRKKRHSTVCLDGQDWSCHRAHPDQSAIHQGDLAKLDRGLRALPTRLRDVLVLSCLDGHSHAECAEILNCSERAIEGRLYRARQRLLHWWENEPT
ncbi:MAG: RNA polymerase sigma factor [Verrucomicrobiales bacterium]